MPYNPGITYRGSDYLFQGAMEGDRALSAGIAAMIQRHRDTARALATYNALQQGDDDDEEWSKEAATPTAGSPAPAAAGPPVDTSAGAPPMAPMPGAGTAMAPPAPGTAGAGPMMNGQPAAQGANGNAQDAMDARGDKADAIRKLVGLYAPSAAKASKAMSLEQLEGTLQAYSIQTARQKQQAQMQDLQAQAQLRRQQALDDESVGRAVNAYAGAPQVPDGNGGMRDPTPDERFQSALKTPGLAGRAVPKLMDSLTRYQQMLAGQDAPVVSKDTPYPGVSIISTKSGRGGVHVVTDPSLDNDPDSGLSTDFSEDPVTGARFATRGKMMTPSGFNPAKAVPQFTAQHDENGNLVGWSNTDARGHSTFTPYKGTGLKTATDDSGNPIPNVYVTPQGQVKDLRTVMQKSGLGNGANGTNGPKVLDRATAADFLKQAGGDLAKAQALAKKAGYTWK
nr:hypothetical protein [uncultured Rhodopila sp.]